MAALAERLERLGLDELSRLDADVRELSYHGASAGWTSAKVRRADELVKRAGAWAVLGLLTFHRDGYMRQFAVKTVSATRHPRALAFVLLRLNDWVPEVRRTAKEVLPTLMTEENVDAVVVALPLILALETKGRDDHRPTVESARVLLRGPNGREALARGVESTDPKVRFACYRLLLGEEAVDLEFFRKALEDPSPMLRVAAIRAGARVESLPVALLDKARADSFFLVRREAFRLLLAVSPARAEQEIRSALLDRSTGLRWEAAYAYWQHTKRRAVELYRGFVAEETGRRQVSAVLGLGEHGDKSDVTVLLPFLSSPSVGLRRGAVRGLARLDGASHLGRFMTALEDPSPGVSTEAKQALLPHAIPSALADRIEALVGNSSASAKARRNALDVLASAGKWRAIAGLVRACGDVDDRLAERAEERVRGWLARYNSSFVQPTPSEIVALASALRLPAARARLGSGTCAELDVVTNPFGN
jgi:HEAT repeat protein